MKFAAVLFALAVTTSVTAAPVAGDGVAPARAHMKRADKPHANPIRKRGGKKCRPRPTGASPTTSSASMPAAQTLVAEPPTDTTTGTAAASPNADGASSSASSSASPAPPSPTPSTTPGGGGGSSAGAPNGNKAGVSSGDAINQFAAHIGWWYDWTPKPKVVNGVIGVPMLWGSGNLGGDQDDASRMSEFKSIAPSSSVPYIMGFEEPDCSTPGSANMDVDTAATVWNQDIAPWGNAGSKLISPSMCKQIEEDFLKPFSDKIDVKWDFTNVHINKNSMEGVKASLDHYASYGKPLWVSEFACVDDKNGFTPCGSEGEMIEYINGIVDILEADDRVVAYAFSNGIGLGDKWRLGTDEQLTPVGQAYLDAIKKHHP